MEENLSRAANRQIDPTTNIVYHSEFSPAPEADAKLKERLQAYTDEAGNEARIEANS